MSVVAHELDRMLEELDTDRARALERNVRELLDRARQTAATQPRSTPQGGWPEGYFQRTAGSFAGEPLERPPQGEDERRDPW